MVVPVIEKLYSDEFIYDGQYNQMVIYDGYYVYSYT